MNFCRLLAEKINKNERKNNAEIIIEEFGEESKEFRDLLKMDDKFHSSIDIQVSSIYFINYKTKLIALLWLEFKYFVILSPF